MSVFNMSFSLALGALKEGQFIAREGWNGKKMFLFMRTGATIPKEKVHELNTYHPWALEFLCNLDRDIVSLPSICMWSAQGEIVNGWLASQTDLLSDDWGVVTAMYSMDMKDYVDE